MITSKSIVKGTIILTVASMLTRLLGFVYRIYMAGTIGAEGMGLYQMMMSIYGLTWSISCAGFTTSISKLVAVENAKKEYGNMARILKQALTMSVVISTLLAIVLYMGADVIALNLIRDERVKLPLQILAFAVPFMAAGSCIRGYFLGLKQQDIPAISQVLEQLLRMGTIFVLAGFLVPLGLTYAIVAAIVGIFVGEFLSFLYMLWAYQHKKKKIAVVSPSLTSKQVVTMILVMALPLGFNRIIGSALGTVEDLLIPLKLQEFGFSTSEAISQYGTLTGMALPLIFFPSTILTALSTSLIPVIAETAAMNQKKKMHYTIEKSMVFTCVVGAFAGSIFLAFAKELGITIYNQDMTHLLVVLGLMCPLWYINITFNGILNGLGQQLYIFKSGLFSSVVNLACIYFLVPIWGVLGFILGWFVSELCISVLDAVKIFNETGVGFSIVKWLLKPFFSGVLATLVVKYVGRHFIFGYFSKWIALLLSISLLGIVFLASIFMLGTMTKEDLQLLFKRKSV